jgi:hypothetical protein
MAARTTAGRHGCRRRASGAAGPGAPPAAPPKLVSSPMPTGEAAIFNMDGLMRVMGKDPKGRAAMFKMVRGAIDSGREPLDQAAWPCRKGGCATPPAPSTACAARSACWAHAPDPGHHGGRKAIHDQREEELDELYRNVRSELEQTLAQARAWLEREQS